MSIRVRNTTFEGWLGGWNTKKAANQLTPIELSDILNMHYDLLGAVERRDGSVRVNSNANVLVDLNVYGLYEYRYTDGTSKTLIASGADLMVWNGTTAFATFGPSTPKESVGVVTDEVPVRWATCISGTANLAAFTDNGNKVVGKVYVSGGNLTAAALGGSPPKGKYLAYWQGRLWIGNITDNTGAGGNAEPSSVYFSTEFNVEAGWGGTSIIKFTPNDGDVITGMAVLNDQLVVFKRNSIHYVSGYGVSTYRQNHLTAGVGCIAPDSIKVIGDAVYFLAKEGVMTYSFNKGVDFIGQAIQKTFSETVNVSLTIREKCVAVHDPLLKQYILCVPSGTGILINDLFLIYHYRDTESEVADREQVWYRGAWTKYSGTNLKACSIAWVEGNLSTSGQLWVGGYDGYVRQMKSGNYDDRVAGASTGSNIEAYATTSWLDMNAPNVVKRVLRAYPIGSQGSSFFINFDYAVDFADQLNTAASFDFEPPLLYLWGGTTWGGGEWNSGTADIPKRKKISLRAGKGYRFQCRLYNKGGGSRFKWYGVGLEWQPLQTF